MGDKSKAVTFRLNKEDLRHAAAAVISRIISRLNTNGSECLEEIQKDFNEATKRDILTGLNEYLSILSSTIDEINDISSLILEIEGGTPKEQTFTEFTEKANSLSSLSSLSPDTEVVEDLPDLQEDSSGVD